MKTEPLLSWGARTCGNCGFFELVDGAGNAGICMQAPPSRGVCETYEADRCGAHRTEAEIDYEILARNSPFQGVANGYSSHDMMEADLFGSVR